MGIFEKLGLRTFALKSIDLVKLVQMYQIKDGLHIYKTLRKTNEAVSVMHPSFVKAPMQLRNNISDKAIFSQVFVENQYTPYKYEYPVVKTVVDAGANIGMGSVLYANMFAEAQIVAIEPNAENFELLKKNTANYPNITCLQTALWNKKEDIFITNPESLAASFMVDTAQPASVSTSTLKGISMADVFAEMKWQSADLVKIDIEGAEKEVFGSADTNWLRGVKLLIIEMHDRYKKGCTKAVFKALEPYDYECEFHHENIFIKFNHAE